MRDTIERLRDIQEAIIRITKYSVLGRQKFEEDELVQIWIIHHLEIIGEAVRAIPQDFKNLHPEVPWKRINGMRNVLVHVYFGVDKNVVWSVVEEDLPALKASVDAILNKEESDDQ